MQETIQQIIAALPVAFSFFAVGFSIWSTIRDRQATRYKSDSDAAAAVSDAATRQMQAAWAQMESLRVQAKECEIELEAVREKVHSLEDVIHAAVGYAGQGIVVGERLQLLVKAQQGAFHPLALRDIEYETDQCGCLAVFAYHMNHITHPDIAAIGRQGAVVCFMVDTII